MAHDRLQAAERVKMSVIAQAALMIHGAVAAMSESGSSDAAKKLQDMVSTYHDLMSPQRVVEREESFEKGKALIEREMKTGYRMSRVDGKESSSGGPGGRKKGLLDRRKKPHS